MTVEVTVRNPQRLHRIDRRRCERLAVRTLERVGREEAEGAVVFVRDSRIREMNLRYRGIDAPTDVLAFQIDGPVPGEAGEILGDVVVKVS